MVWVNVSGEGPEQASLLKPLVSARRPYAEPNVSTSGQPWLADSGGEGRATLVPKVELGAERATPSD